MNYTNAVVLILSMCSIVWYVEAQRGRQAWRQSRFGGRRQFGQQNNRNRGRGRHGQFRGNRGLFAGPIGSGNHSDSGLNTGPGLSSVPAAFNPGSPSNAMSIQNEVRRQETGIGSVPVVISNPLVQETGQPSVVPSTGHPWKGRKGKKNAQKKRYGKRAHRQKKKQKKKKKARNKKKKEKERKRKQLRKQQDLLKFNMADPSGSKKGANRWMKRREKILDRMRARKAKLDERKKKEAKIRAEKQRLREERQNNLPVKQAENVKMKEVLKDGAIVPNETPMKLLKIDEPKVLIEINNNTKTMDSEHNSNDAIGSMKIVDVSGTINTPLLLNNANTGSMEELNLGNSIPNSNQDALKGIGADTGSLTNLGTPESQNTLPVDVKETFLWPVVPGFTVNDMPLIDLADTRDPWSQLGPTGERLGIPAFLTPINSGGIFQSNSMATVSDVPIKSVETRIGVPLGHFDPSTGVQFKRGESGTNVPFQLVDAKTDIVSGGQADAGIGALVKPDDRKMGVLLRSENNGPSAPFGPVDSRQGVPLGSIDNGKGPHAGLLDLPLDFSVDALAPGVGVGTPFGISDNITGKPDGQIDTETGMRGIPLGPMENGVGNPLDTAVLDSQDNVREPSFGSNQLAVLKSVDLREFLSTGKVKVLDTNNVALTKPEKMKRNGIQTISGEVMPVAGQPRATSASGTINTEPSRSTKSSKPASSLLSVVFDITRALRPGRR